MEKPLPALEISLRVLTAINEQENPEPTDVERLRHIVPDYNGPVDALVCEVVQRASKELQKDIGACLPTTGHPKTKKGPPTKERSPKELS